MVFLRNIYNRRLLVKHNLQKYRYCSLSSACTAKGMQEAQGGSAVRGFCGCNDLTGGKGTGIIRGMQKILSLLVVFVALAARAVNNGDVPVNTADSRLLGSNDGGRSSSVLDACKEEKMEKRFQERRYTIERPAAFDLYRLQIDKARGPQKDDIQLSEIRLME
jgi:hypothetical protein